LGPSPARHRSCGLVQDRSYGLVQGCLAVVLIGIAAALSGCVGAPKGVTPIDGFEVDRYLGRWYEIARLDHSFERGLTHVTAEYAPRDDGGLEVINSGYSERAAARKVSVGRAYFVGSKDVGALKVSFFGPFFGGYNIIELDRDDYAYALVCGPNRDFLWILARSRTLAPAVRDRLVDRARALDFPVEELIWVDQSLPAPGGAAATP
jgi:apolipoprotein D and lipocalin family protein